MKRNFPSALRPAPHSGTCVRRLSLGSLHHNSRTSRKSASHVTSRNRNVWSAASPQAKFEDATSWSAQMYTAFVGVDHSWPGWNALRSLLHYVWSAASPQAKFEDATSWSAQMYTA